MRKAYKFRLYPTRKQEQQLQWTLDRCRELYNAALQERKEAWKYERKRISYYDQKRDVVDIKELRPEYKEIHSQVLQDVIGRVESPTMRSLPVANVAILQDFHAFRGTTAMTPSPIHKVGTPSLLIPACASRKLGASRSSSIERYKAPSRPVRSNEKLTSGMWSSPVKEHNPPCCLLSKVR